MHLNAQILPNFFGLVVDLDTTNFVRCVENKEATKSYSTQLTKSKVYEVDGLSRSTLSPLNMFNSFDSQARSQVFLRGVPSLPLPPPFLPLPLPISPIANPFVSFPFLPPLEVEPLKIQLVGLGSAVSSILQRGLGPSPSRNRI